jgi:hypothetical protein
MTAKFLFFISITTWSFHLAPARLCAQPVVDSLNIDESKGVIELWGKFGLDNQVVIQYTQLPLQISTPSYIRCTIPDAGAGACGEVRVYSAGKSSAPRLITQWSMVISNWFQHLYSDGGFDYIGDTLSIRFRIDMVQMVMRHRTESFNLLSERTTYNHSVAGGSKGQRGGGLSYGTQDSTERGPIVIGINLWNQQLDLPRIESVPLVQLSQPVFDPDFSIRPVFPSYYSYSGGGTSAYVPLDGATIAQFLPKDSLLWVNIFGPMILGPRCAIHLTEPITVHYERDSVFIGNGWFYTLDSGTENRTITCDWNTSNRGHITRAARSYLIIDTLQSPFPHEERIQVLLSDSSKNIDQISMRYRSLSSTRSDSIDVYLSVYAVGLAHSPSKLDGFYNLDDNYHRIYESYYHYAYQLPFEDWTVRRDTIMVSWGDHPSFAVTFFTDTDAVAISTSASISAPGFILREKLAFLVASGITEIYDVLGRPTSIRGVSEASSIRPGLYFARVGQSIMKLLN